MIYKLIYPNKSCQRHVEKFLEGLQDGIKDEILNNIFELKNNPRPHGYIHLKPPTKVFSYLADYRIVIGDFRVFYDIDDKSHRVILYAIRQRNEKTYK